MTPSFDLSPSTTLPRDGTAGALAGRIWLPELDGPSVVAIRADGGALATVHEFEGGGEDEIFRQHGRASRSAARQRVDQREHPNQDAGGAEHRPVTDHRFEQRHDDVEEQLPEAGAVELGRFDHFLGSDSGLEARDILRHRAVEKLNFLRQITEELAHCVGVALIQCSTVEPHEAAADRSYADHRARHGAKERAAQARPAPEVDHIPGFSPCQ